MLNESIENIEQKITKLKELKGILKQKLDGVNYQIAQEKTKLSKEKEQIKLKHLKHHQDFSKN